MSRYLCTCCLKIIATVALVLATCWSLAALMVDGPSTAWIEGVTGGTLLAGTTALFLLFIWWQVRPWGRAITFSFLLCAGVLGWWLTLTPRNDRNWLPDVARPPEVVIDGDQVTIHNVRNFLYRSESDFTEQWETRHYDLSKVVGVDLFLSYWGSPYIAHTIASWEFEDGKHLAISIETRKEIGEQYSAVLGFFRQYELYFVVADERDVVGVRTSFRGEDMYLYRINNTADEARKLLEAYLIEANALAHRPRWYNAFSHNCTTGIRKIRFEVGQGRPWDWRIMANGYLDQLGYEQGMIANDLPFPEVRQRARITDRAKQHISAVNFSELIRNHE